MNGKGWSISEDEARFYVAVVSLALGYIHSKDVIYRDLKPENLVLMADGYPSLVDFGFAKYMAGESRTFTVCGTMPYMAPEVRSKDGHGTPVDVWGLGVLTYELLMGKNSQCAKHVLTEALSCYRAHT